ncbi:MAG TPA: hypothetical protein VFJ58_06690 [Armatimonadota bacterium]|nr:hypothetical protein [Armatimonadota bacterium]
MTKATAVPLWTTYDLIAKFREIEIEISAEKGSFALFVAIAREDAPDRLDLIVSAPWVGENKRDARKILTGKLQSKLEMHELRMLGRVEVLDPNEPFVQVWHRVSVVEHAENLIFNNLTVRGQFGSIFMPQAYLITSKPVDDSSVPPSRRRSDIANSDPDAKLVIQTRRGSSRRRSDTADADPSTLLTA